MKTLAPAHHACPHCASNEFRFEEHGAGVTIFRCDHCGRATVAAWAPLPAPTPPATEPPASLTWFTRSAEGSFSYARWDASTENGAQGATGRATVRDADGGARRTATS
jgi:hypothetical protein